MESTVTCKSNGGFEDQLTTGDSYAVLEVGENDYSILNDKGVIRWYGAMHFYFK